jgi:microcystin-dependent protein
MKMLTIAVTVFVLAIGTFTLPPNVEAQECFIGEVRLFAGNFAPRSWAFCNGQLLSISQNSALFSILGTTYGGDGRTTFGLPDLRGRVPVHVGGGSGSGPGLSPYTLGQKGGQENVTLNTSQIPSHNHDLMGSPNAASATSPAGNLPGTTSRTRLYSSSSSANVAMDMDAISSEGGGQSHENRPPYQGLNYIICLYGIYPSRN